MSKWKCGICNNEFDNFQAQGFSGTIYCPLCYFKELYRRTELERERLNNIINELEWKPIEQYEKPKYDWVLVKYFIEPNFECVPCVAENRFGEWYDINDNLINGEIRYFFDMQQLDKLKALKEDNNV